MTIPAHRRPAASIARTVSSVSDSVPSPALATTTTGASSDRARSRTVRSVPSRTSTPPAPSTRSRRPRAGPEVAGESGADPPSARSHARIGSINSGSVDCGRPATRAAVSGASGSGSRRTSSTRRTPDRRAASWASPGSPGPSPVWIGLQIPTSRPSDRPWAASAAVATVLPTSVPVPVMTIGAGAGGDAEPGEPGRDAEPDEVVMRGPPRAARPRQPGVRARPTPAPARRSPARGRRRRGLPGR